MSLRLLQVGVNMCTEGAMISEFVKYLLNYFRALIMKTCGQKSNIMTVDS